MSRSVDFDCDLCGLAADPRTTVNLKVSPDVTIATMDPNEASTHVCENCASTIALAMNIRADQRADEAPPMAHPCPAAETDELNCHCRVCEEHAQIEIERSRPCE